MTSRNDYQSFVNGLNYGHHDSVMHKDNLIMHLSFDARVMSPSEATNTIASLLNEGIITRKGDMIDLGNLYDSSKRLYVMKGRTGKTLKPKSGVTGARTVRYVAPGHTQITYAHRILDVRFKESQKEFDARARLRRSKAAKIAAKTRANGIDALYLDVDSDGNPITVTKTGKKADSKARTRTVKGKAAMTKKKLAKDKYTIEDMRALLRDDHWEEVCGHKRWNYDNASTVREFNKYLKRRN